MVSPLPPRWVPGSFLARLTDDQVDELLALGVRRQFATGRALLREGDAGTHVEILLRGIVKVTNVVDGTEVLVGIRLPGDMVGEVAGLTGRPRMATVTACGPVLSCVVSQADLNRFLGRHPTASLRMAAALADRLRWANDRRADFAAYPPEVRLARLLHEIAQICGRPVPDGILIGVELSQLELATMVGVSEATAQKALRDLREQGIIGTGYRRITVHDPEALRARGAGDDGWRTLTG